MNKIKCLLVFVAVAFPLSLMAASTPDRDSSDLCPLLTRADMPYIMDFDDVSITSQEIPCWRKLSYNPNNPGHPAVTPVYSTTANGHSLLFVSGSNSQPIFAVMPGVDSLSNCMLSFSWLMAGGANLQVGVMTDPDDTTTFEPLMTFASGNGVGGNIQWTSCDLSLIDVSDGAHWVAFRAGANGTSAHMVYLDDVTLTMLPDCMWPSEVRITDITQTSALFHIVDFAETMHYSVVFVGNDSLDVTDTVVLYENFAPGTRYDVRVYTVCGDSTSENFFSTSFQTLCSGIVVDGANPYMESFESMNGDLERCWERRYCATFSNANFNVDTSNSIFIDSSYAHTGSKSLCLDVHNYFSPVLVLPIFEGPVQRLRLSFWFKESSALFSNKRLAVGVCRTTEDSSTFTRLATFLPADTAWHRYEVDLGDYADSGNRITIFYNGLSYGHSYGYLDDIQLEVLSCSHPVGVRVSELSATSATITWTDYSFASDYRLVINGDEDSAVVTNGIPFQFSLVPDSVYTVSVSTWCDTGYSEARSVTFRAPCLPFPFDSLPWSENFDGLAVGNRVAVLETGCMRLFRSNNNNYFYYPSINSGRHFGSSGNSLEFATVYGEPQIMVLPAVEGDVYNLMFSSRINISNYSNVNNAFVLGVMPNAADPSSFIPVDTFFVNAADTWEYVEHRFDNYNGPNGHIAVRPLNNNSGNLYIDDVKVGEIYYCYPVQHLRIVGLGSTEVTLAIVDTNAQESYRVWLTSPTDTAAHSADIASSEITISNLLPNTTYIAHAATVCNEVPTISCDFEFTTLCFSAAMPWSENFDALLPRNIQTLMSNCWSFYGGTTACIDSVLAGTGELVPNANDFGIGSVGVSSSNGLYAIRYGLRNRYDWMVAPPISIVESAALLFDVSLSDRLGGGDPLYLENDRLVVAVTSDGGATWTPFAVWDGDTTLISPLRASHFSISDLFATTKTIAIPLGDTVVGDIRIGFYFESAVEYSNSQFHVDDIFIVPVSCLPPLNIVPVSIGVDTAILSWTGSADRYEYMYAPEADTSIWITGTVNDTVVVLAGVAHSTDYLFRVRSVCGSGPSHWVEFTFRTECGMIVHSELPYTEDFNRYYDRLNPCWTGDVFRWMIVDTDLVLLLNQNGYVAMPQFDSLNDLYVHCKTYVLNDMAELEIGVMSDPSDTSSFSTVATLFPQGINSLEEFYVPFSGCIGPGQHIAFRAVNRGYGIIGITGVVVDVLRACVDSVALFVVDDIVNDSATFDVGLGLGLYDSVIVTLATNEGVVVRMFSACRIPHRFTLTNLAGGTSYRVSLAVYCQGDIVASDTLSFATPNVGLDDTAQESPFEIYPNPATSTVTILGVESGAVVTLVDISGRTVQTVESSDNQGITLNVGHLAKGAYFVRIVTAKTMAVRKVIVP